MAYIGNRPPATSKISNLLADIKIGEDDETKIDFADANTINFHANNSKEMVLVENAFTPGTSDGIALGTTSLMWSDIFLASGGVMNFNNGNVTITHTNGTGLTINSTNKLMFGDAASFVQQSSDGVLRIDGEATVDINASTAVTVSNDLKLDSDSAVLSFGADSEASITHADDAGLTFNSATTFSSSINLALDAHLDSTPGDEKVSGITATFQAGEALVRGEAVYFKASDSKMWKAVATAAATSRCVALAAEDLSADANGKFLLYGFIEDNGTFPAYTVGATVFTPEAETSSQNVPEETVPDSDGDFVQVLGFAVTANKLFFNPSNDVIEHA